ncbi:MAG: hypothetical protein MZW92_28980 [Comamonadaceae bacterium]|nr:hypothetical protein [Comamonadaceae bacterium]
MNAPESTRRTAPDLALARRRLRLQDRARRAVARSSPRARRRCPCRKELLVGIETADDAAVYQLNDAAGARSPPPTSSCRSSTTRSTSARIAATNAISDVYAMGGTAALRAGAGGHADQRAAASTTIRRVLEGGESVCRDGRHPDRRRPHDRLGRADLRPGRASASCDPQRVKRNAGAQAGRPCWCWASRSAWA